MPLSDKQIVFLRKNCHHLKPIVTVGNAGPSENVINEINAALNHHELLKIKLNAGDRETRKHIIDDIVKQTNAVLIQTIGHTASFYRAADKPILELPKC